MSTPGSKRTRDKINKSPKPKKKAKKKQKGPETNPLKLGGLLNKAKKR